MRDVAWLAAALVVAFASCARSSDAAAPELCRAPGLTLTAHDYGEAGGQFRQTFTFRNVTAERCVLTGWPAFRLVSAAGRAVPTKTQRVRQTTPPAPASKIVVLAPHRTASFNVYGADFDALHDVACPRTAAAAITAPQTTSPVFLRLRVPNCGTFYVAPVVAGSSDRDSWSTYVR